jgi:hypothetical protein
MVRTYRTGWLALYLPVGIVFCGWFASRTHTVRLGDDGACELRSLVRRRRLHASSIAWVRAERDDEHDIVDASVGYCRG